MKNHLVVASALVLSLLVAGNAGGAAAAPGDFGFSGPEFHKLHWDTRNLRLSDINGDKLNDVVVVNNAKARIECLIQRAHPAEAPPAAENEPNVIPNDPRFESRPFLPEKKIFSLELGDLNGDGRTDMAYYGDPPELVVVYQNDKGQWGDRREFNIRDGSPHPYGLAIADLNSDGRDDLALIATDGVYLIHQNAEGKLDAPRKESGLPEGAFAIAIRDFNGDGRHDLLYMCTNETAPLCLRIQGADHRLGPEIRCRAPSIRAAAIGNLDGEGAEEVVAIQMKSGRLVAYRTADEPADKGLLDGSLERYALRTAGGRKTRALAIGPFSKTGRSDILITDPDAAEIEMFVQSDGGPWHRRAAFPSLKAGTDLAVIDVDADGRAEVLVLSPDEPMLGLARMDANGRLTFPRALPVAGKPTCVTVADLSGDGKPEIIYAAAEDSKRALHVLRVASAEDFPEATAIPLEKARADPAGLLVADANQDGLSDIIVFTPYQEMRILKQVAGGKFVDVSRGPNYGKGLVQKATLRATGIADVDGDGKAELLLASKNFARALRLDAEDRLEIVDQFNGRTANSLIVAVAGADVDGDGTPEIILADSTNACLTALRRNKMGVYEIAHSFQTGAMTPDRLVVRNLAGDARPEILTLGKNDFSVLRLGAPRTVLRETASYETSIRNGRLNDMVLGDLNGDGRMDVLASEGTKNRLELLTWQGADKPLERALSWRVFEAKSFAGSRFDPGSRRSSEPREFDIKDVTGDGKPDIVLLVHDRILVYPQQ